jgi:hypothetical protein
MGFKSLYVFIDDRKTVQRDKPSKVNIGRNNRQGMINKKKSGSRTKTNGSKKFVIQVNCTSELEVNKQQYIKRRH